MKELEYPEDLSDIQLYNSVKGVLNSRGYTDSNESSELPYRSDPVTVELDGETIKILGSSKSEEDLIAKLLEPEIESPLFQSFLKAGRIISMLEANSRSSSSEDSNHSSFSNLSSMISGCLSIET